MDTKILRQKILDLAIHGRLVPQDPNDEPASALLARIRAEKEQLVKDGKLKKKDLVTTPVSDEDMPFEVPEGWEWVTVKDVCSKFTTGPFGSMVHKTDYVTDGGIPLINPANMIDGAINMNKMMYVSVSKAVELQRYILENSDILLARRGDLSKCVIVNEEHVGSLCGTGSFVLHAILLEPRYFAMIYASTYIQSILKKECVGATMDNLNQGLLGSLPIPLPPLAEQQRIVAAVEQWMSLVDMIESGKENLQQSIALAKNKILDLAINGKLVEKEGEWEEKTLGEVAFIRDNLRKPINSSERANRIAGKKEEELYPYYGATGQVGYIDEYLMDGNYILLGEDGAPFLDKFATKAYAINGKCWVNNHAHVLEPKCEMQYLLHVLNITDYHVYAKGSTRLKLTQADMVKISIPLPPLSEQRRIVAKVEEIFAQLDNIAQALK